MFWSKIWLFIVALAAAVSITFALVMPRPAERAAHDEQVTRLRLACSAVDVELQGNALAHLGIVGTFAHDSGVETALADATAATAIDPQKAKAAQQTAAKLIGGIEHGDKPAFAILVDHRGRVLARAGIDEDDFGDLMSGRPLVDDALAGYTRDDVWVQGGSLYFVVAASVVKRDPPVTYSGAVILGYKATNDLAAKLKVTDTVNVGLFARGQGVATSTTAAIEAATLVDSVKQLTGPDLRGDCPANAPVELTASGVAYRALAARLPGEAGARGAFYAVFEPQPAAIGFKGTLDAVTKSDLSFGHFPWILVGGALVLALGIGIALMLIEADRPLRKLTADTVKLAKGETDRLSETAHGGKFGSIARSVNIHIDKLGREAKSAKKDFDQLLGPAPEGSLGTIDLLSGSLPPIAAAPPMARPSNAPPPPSEFRFTGASAPPPAPVAAPPPPPAPAMRPSPPVAMAVAPSAPRPPPMRPGAPAAPPVSAAAPPPPPVAASAPSPTPTGTSAPLRLDDDILGSGTTIPPPMGDAPGDPYFKQVFEQFLAVKKSCNEPTTGLSFAKFAEKLVKNREELMKKTNCREVRFTVYVKEGKAALKATPVKDE